MLRPGRPAAVVVTDAGLPAAGARVQLAVGFERLLVGVAETDREERARFPTVPMGSLHAEARLGDQYGRATEPADAPLERTLRVELVPARTLEVLVVEKGSGAPIEGADVRLEERVQPPRTFFRSGDVWTPDERPVPAEVHPTDAAGRTRVAGLPHGVSLNVSAAKDGYRGGWRERAASKRVDPEAVEVTVELERERYRDLRIPLVDGEVPAPAEGTSVALRPQPGMSLLPPEHFPAAGLVRAGEIVVEGAPSGNFGALAQSPDGAVARLWCDEEAEVGNETSFRRPRTILVRIEDAAGSPVAGAEAIARNQGNNELCDWVGTDAQGIARLTGLHGGLAEVHVRAPGEEGRGTKAGSVDLDEGDGEVRLALGARSAVEVELALSIDGEPRLPARFFVHGARIVSEDPERGAVRVSVEAPPAGTPAKCTVNSPEFLPATVELSHADLERGGPIAVALRRAGAIQIEVERAPETRVKLSAQRSSDEPGVWVDAGHLTLVFPNADDDRFRIDLLEPGRYRVKDGLSGAVSEAVEVDPQLGDARVLLDLSATAELSGRIVGPEGCDLSLARVLVEGGDVKIEVDPWNQRPGTPAGSVPVRGEDGSFKVRIPTDRPVTLRAWHPILRAASDHGALTITGAAGEVVLALEVGTLCVFDVPEGTGEGRPLGLRVLLFDGVVDADPVGEFSASIDAGRARFGGFAPGRYTLWIDPASEFQPLVLADVALGESETDLGAQSFSRGSSIRFRIAVPAGQSPPRISAWAWSLGRPEYRRGLNSEGEAEVVLSGFGAGTFQLSYGPVMGASAQERRPLTLDGEHDELIELGL